MPASRSKLRGSKGPSNRRRSTTSWVGQACGDRQDTLDSNELQEVEEEGNEMSEMLEILQQLQKKRSANASARGADILAKKAVLVKTVHEKANFLKVDGAAHIENCRSILEELHASEVAPDGVLDEVYQLFADRVLCVENLLEAYHPILSEFRKTELSVLAQVHETLAGNGPQREITRRKLMRKAKKGVLDNIEQRKLVTDADAYIKEFKKLVLI